MLAWIKGDPAGVSGEPPLLKADTAKPLPPPPESQSMAPSIGSGSGTGAETIEKSGKTKRVVPIDKTAASPPVLKQGSQHLYMHL